MKSRTIGAIAAVLLAVVGAVLLIQYVGAAEQRALAGTETQSVLVVRDGLTVPEGTPAEGLVDYVDSTDVPSRVVPTDSINSLAEVTGLVTGVDLVAGEQVLSTRFVDPESALNDQVIDVPEGMQEVTILLEPQRAAGGQIRAGDTVGVFISLDGRGEANPLAVTHLTLHKVLVTNVQGLPGEVEETDETASAPVPTGSVLVTVARAAPDAEKIVYGQEFGRIWLSKEPISAAETGTRPITADEIYE